MSIFDVDKKARPMATEMYSVVISGGSFAGLALARSMSLALGAEAPIAVIDRGAPQKERATDVRAFAITAASKRMLGVLGVWPRVAGEAQAVSKIDITDSSLDAGVRPVLLGYDNTINGGEPASFIVPSEPLQRALHELVSNDRSITLVSPAEAVDFESSSTAVEVALADGRTLRASMLVAADGRRSALREAAGIKTTGWKYGQTGIVTIVEHERPHEGRAVQHFLPGGPFAMLPLPGNRSCITWSEEEGEAKRILALDDAGFLAEIERRFGGKLGAIQLAGPRQSWPLELHLARSYVAPRFAVIGDAAHVVHPIAGQGLNLALRDVAALTEVLADGARLGLDIGNWDGLRRYERWRRFDTAASAAAFDGLNRMFSNDGTVTRALRDFGLGLVDRMPGLKHAVVKEASGLTGELPRLLKGEMA